MDDARTTARKFHAGQQAKSYIYAIGFSDGTVKIGRAVNPKNRFSVHCSDRARRDVGWLHLFEPCCSVAMRVAVVEYDVLEQMAAKYQRVRRTETFAGATRDEVIKLIRIVIVEAKRVAALKSNRRSKATAA